MATRRERRMAQREKERSAKQAKTGFKWWTWPVVGTVGALLFGGGVSAMTSGHPLLADLQFVLSFVLLGAKLARKEIRQTRTGKMLIVVSALVVAGLVRGVHYINRSLPISVSPDVLSITSDKWHDIEEVTISNENGTPRYSAFLTAAPSDTNVEFGLVPSSGPGSDAGDGQCLILAGGSLLCPIIRIAPHGYVMFRVDAHLKTPGTPSRILFTVSEGSHKPEDRTRRTYKSN